MTDGAMVGWWRCPAIHSRGISACTGEHIDLSAYQVVLKSSRKDQNDPESWGGLTDERFQQATKADHHSAFGYTFK